MASDCVSFRLNASNCLQLPLIASNCQQDSSNIDASVLMAAWSMGCHMVCLNFQTWDLPMRLNFAKFLANGSSGYVLKVMATDDH